MNADILLSRLEKVSSCGENKWKACCPAHDDKHPSLTIAELSDGRVMIKCWTGCGAADVMAAVQLNMSDLFPKALGEFRSFMRMEKEIQSRKQPDQLHNKLLLELFDAKRARGERLTPQELRQEQAAYLEVRHANH